MATDLGRDVYCSDSLRTGRYASGPTLVGLGLYHRLSTPRGMLRGAEDEEEFGLDLSDLVGAEDSEAQAAALPGKIRGEARKDERIDAESVEVNVVRTVDGTDVEYEITIRADTSEGPFELVLGVDGVTVSLLKLATEAE